MGAYLPLLGVLVPAALSLALNLLIVRRVKRRGHWIVTVGGPESGRRRWISGPDDDTDNAAISAEENEEWGRDPRAGREG